MTNKSDTTASRLASLAPFIGRWRTTINMIEGDKTSRHHATDTYRWALGKRFIFHDVEGQMGGKPVQTLEIMSVKGTRNFNLRSYDNAGQIADYTAALDGRDWWIDGERLRFRGSFDRSWATLEGQWEQKAGHRWRPWLSIRLEKDAEDAGAK